MLNQTIFSEEIEVYEKVLKEIPSQNESKKATYIRNSSKEHGTALFVEILKRAEKEVKILTSTFCKDFYLQEKIINGLQKKKENINIYILIREENSDPEIGQDEVIQEYKKNQNIEILFLTEQGRNKAQKINDFIVADNNSFRYELEYNGNKSCKGEYILKTKAFAAFNTSKDTEQNNAQELSESFDILKKYTTPHKNS